MGDYGIKISQPGFDVKTAAKENLVFSSKYDTFKEYTHGSGTITIAAAVDAITPRLGTVTLAHSLGYFPAFFVFSNNPVWDTASHLSPYTWRSIGSSYNQPNYSIDSGNLYMNFWNPDNTASHDYEYHWYLFYNQLL